VKDIEEVVIEGLVATLLNIYLNSSLLRIFNMDNKAKYYCTYDDRPVEIHWLSKYAEFQIVYADTLETEYVDALDGLDIIYS
jgi:hypothetical protein